MKWQTIDSAPRDGTHVLIAEYTKDIPVKRWWVSQAWYDSEHDGWWETNTDYSDYTDRRCYPSHWMPLPEPPTE